MAETPHLCSTLSISGDEKKGDPGLTVGVSSNIPSLVMDNSLHKVRKLWIVPQKGVIMCKLLGVYLEWSTHVANRWTTWNTPDLPYLVTTAR